MLMVFAAQEASKVHTQAAIMNLPMVIALQMPLKPLTIWNLRVGCQILVPAGRSANPLQPVNPLQKTTFFGRETQYYSALFLSINRNH